MIIKGLLTDRQPLIKSLERLTGIKAQYAGAPSFVYFVGKYKVTRNGDIEVDDSELNDNSALNDNINLGTDIESEHTDSYIFSQLAALGLVSQAPSSDPSSQCIESLISVPISDFTGRAMVNIVNAFAAKGDLVNKSVGGSFDISLSFVKLLADENPATLDDFRHILYTCGGAWVMQGLTLTADHLVFTGFPQPPDDEHLNAWRQFVDCLVATAKVAHHLKSKPLKTANDKYTFRAWLNTLGMKGPEFKEARAILLAQIEGNGSFKTDEQLESFYKERRLRNAKSEPAFVAL